MAGYFYIGGEKMDLLVEKDGQRTYLSRYKVITTSFEESSPSIKRNNTQIQYRNGNVDFGGWHESKTIDYVGYYRADDLEDEEYLRERIYALLSDPEGYYVTQLKNENDNSFERPGETSGDYFDKQVNRPSHKRFYVYASSLESELVGSYGGHVLYKISAMFTTMKLPYGESVPRDLDVKPNAPYYGRNLLLGTSNSQDYTLSGAGWTAGSQSSNGTTKSITATPGESYTYSLIIKSTTFNCYPEIQFFDSDKKIIYTSTSVHGTDIGVRKTTGVAPKNAAFLVTRMLLGGPQDSQTVVFNSEKLELGDKVTPWSPAPEDPGYNEWYLDTYYNTKNLVIPYAGTVPCNQLEQRFAIEFTAKEAGSRLVIDVNGTKLTYNGQIYSGDVIKLSGYEYTKNDISIVKSTNKSYFKLIPGIANTVSSNLYGSIRILDYQDLYA